MSIAIVIVFEASLLFSEYCTGLQYRTETDGGANLECKVVQVQPNTHGPIPAGIEDVFINGTEYADCTLYEESVQTDNFGQNNVALYYRCPGTVLMNKSTKEL